MKSNTALRMDVCEEITRSADMLSGEAASMMTSVAQDGQIDMSGKLSGVQTCLMTSVADV